MHHQVRIIEVEREGDGAGAGERAPQRRVDVQVERVAERVRLAGRVGLDAGGEVRGVMAADAAAT